MTRTQWLLIALVAAELAVGGYLVGQRLRRPTPPIPDRAAVDPVTADEICARARDCRTADHWRELGKVYLATGFFPEAEACLRVASALQPDRADVALEHAFALERIGRLEEANAQYETAVRLNSPRAADCSYYHGKNHLRREQPQEAAAAFARAGGLPGARYELALLDARMGRVVEAEAEARRLADEFPAAYPPVALRYRLAVARSDQSAADSLADQFTRRPRPLPTPFDTEVDWIFGLANGVGPNRLFRDAGRAMQAGRAANAETLLRSALAAGWSPEIADKLADVLFVRGRPAEAAEVLTEALARGGPSFGLLWRLGQAADAAGQPARTLDLWERASRLATGPRARGLWEDLAARYERSGDPDRAKRWRSQAYLAAGMNELDAGKSGDAVELLTRAAEANPHLAHAWYYLGEAQRLNDRPADARAAYARCLEIDPDHGRARRGRKLVGE